MTVLHAHESVLAISLTCQFMKEVDFQPADMDMALSYACTAAIRSNVFEFWGLDVNFCWIGSPREKYPALMTVLPTAYGRSAGSDHSDGASGGRKVNFTCRHVRVDISALGPIPKLGVIAAAGKNQNVFGRGVHQ